MEASKRRGVALVYVLLLIMVLSILSVALVFRYQMTARVLQYGQGTVRARELADSAVELAVLLLRDQDLEWYKNYKSPVTSEALGYDEERLGGRFELEFEVLKEAYPAGQGSFLTIVGTALSDGQRARTAATVKLASPLTNFVFFSSGSYVMGPSTVSGPIFAGSTAGDANIQMYHDNRYFSAQAQDAVHSHGTVNFSGQLKASGKIYLRNLDSVDNMFSQGEKFFDGLVPAGQVQHQDLTVPVKGKVSLGGAVNAQPNVRVGVDMPKMSEVLSNFRTKSDKTVIDISAYGEGVMAEFVGGELVVSKAASKTVGHVFDKDMYNGYRSDMASLILNNTNNQVDSATADRILRDSVAWDDPDIPNQPYPDELKTDLDGDGTVETEGDAVPVTRMVRGEELTRVRLSRDDWSTVQFVTSRTDYLDATGSKSAPPLYLRGNVKGKVNLVYDVTDDSLDPKYDRLRTIVLSEHEMPGDSQYQIASGAPGVPGGLRYEDTRIAAQPSDTNVSPDVISVISRGSLNAGGNTRGYKARVRDEQGQLFDYDKALADLAVNYGQHFSTASGHAASDYNNSNSWTSTAPAYGVFIASSNPGGARVAYGSTVVNGGRKAPSTGSEFRWSSFATMPASITNTTWCAVLPLRQRNVGVSNGGNLLLRGSASSLKDRLRTTGSEARYDYKLQALDAKVLAQEMGLPVTVVLCTWQRL